MVQIRAGDEWKTPFSTTSGHYQNNVMAYGLVNATAFFQAFMNDVFRDMINRYIIVYLDDILIYSKNLAEHVTHVRKVLHRLLTHRLYTKAKK